MRNQGFTLIELMIVVAIIGVLAAISVGAYKKYSDSGRASEVAGMFGEFRAKEEAIKAETNAYLSTTTTGESDLYPVLGSCTEPCPKVDTAPPPSWSTATPSLGINPQRKQLYCGYVAIAGAANSWGTIAGTKGKNAFNNVVPTVPWYYLYAECDNNKNKATNTTYITTSQSTTLIVLNEHD